MRVTTIILLSSSIFSCRNSSEETGISAGYDSIIEIPASEDPITKNESETQKMKEAIYDHFRKQGYCIEHEMPDGIPDDSLRPTCMSIENIYFTARNAMLGYWLVPAGASGHCWQPHKAVISKNRGKYSIQMEDFLSPEYNFDSIIRKKSESVLYGYRYDCGNHAIIDRFKILLKE